MQWSNDGHWQFLFDGRTKPPALVGHKCVYSGFQYACKDREEPEERQESRGVIENSDSPSPHHCASEKIIDTTLLDVKEI
jgi:hypothetical protein